MNRAWDDTVIFGRVDEKAPDGVCAIHFKSDVITYAQQNEQSHYWIYHFSSRRIER